MDFSEKMRELVRKGATVDVVASSLGLDISLVLRSLDASRLGQGTVEVKELHIPRVYQAGLPV